jgi:adenylylsulfate kinase-like enzyme
MKRDLKGLYAKAINGEIRNFTGIDDPYEEPSSPEIVVETDRNSMKQCTDLILDWIRGVSDWKISRVSPASRKESHFRQPLKRSIM